MEILSITFSKVAPKELTVVIQDRPSRALAMVLDLGKLILSDKKWRVFDIIYTPPTTTDYRYVRINALN